MKIKKIFLIVIALLFSVNFLYAEKCEYRTNWDKCIEANKNWSVLSIDAETDFLCRESNNGEEVLYNIILDKKFKIIDEEINKELKAIEENKNYYFWADKKKSFMDWVDMIEKRFWVYGHYYNQYYNSCDEILVEWEECIEEKTKVGANIADLIEITDKSNCIKLAELKLNIRRSVAYDVLLLNKQAVRRDEMKKYEQIQRWKYDMVFDLMITNLWYWARMAQKWPSKTKNPHK